MPGDIQNRQTVSRQAGKRPFPLHPVPFLHPGKLGIFRCFRFARRSGKRLLIRLPLFEIDGTHRLRGNLSRIIRVRSFLKISQTLTEFSHAEGAIHGRCLHRNVAHKDDGPGTFFLKTQTDSRQLFMQLGPRFRVFYDAVAAFLRDALGGFFAGGMFKIQRGLLRFYLSGRSSSRQFTVFQYGVQGAFFTGPSLFMLNERHNFMGLADIQSVERKHDFSRFRVHPVDRDMQVIIVRVIVQAIHSLMSGQLHFFKEQIHHFLNLFPCGLLPFLPGKYPVRYRHPAM